MSKVNHRQLSRDFGVSLGEARQSSQGVDGVSVEGNIGTWRTFYFRCWLGRADGQTGSMQASWPKRPCSSVLAEMRNSFRLCKDRVGKEMKAPKTLKSEIQ